jgi:hypothetical protein
MKKIFLMAIVAASIVSCKKDDGVNGGSGSGGPQITSATFQTQYSAGAKFAGYTVDSGIISTPLSGANQSYNYANITMGAAWKDTLKTPGTNFSGATYMQGASLNLLNQNAAFFRYYKVDNTNWTILGDAVSAVNVNIPGTGSLSSSAQNSAKSPNQILVNFPVSYTYSFSQVSNSELNFTASATVPVFGSKTGPLTVKQETTITSKNLSWGTLKLKGYTDSMQCVVQKYTTSVKTNFSSTDVLINGLIDQILNQVTSGAVNNNQVVTTTMYRFWVANKGLVMTLNANGTANVTTGL